ncbi:MAG: hypothetical protein GXP37_09515 [Chloroflexi bacterium]|nr:hypothetical protein [Chloroflexota bacterium]
MIPTLWLLLVAILLIALAEWALRRRALHRTRDWNTPPLFPPDRQARRIVVLGDSIAYGYGLDPTQAWPHLLAARLQHTYAQQRWQVINASVAGHTVGDAYLRFAEHVIAAKPHLVLIAFGINDCRRVWRMNDARRMKIFAQHEQSWWGRSYLLRGLVNRLHPLPRATVVNETALAPTPRIPLPIFWQMLSWLGRQSRRYGVQPALLTLTPIHPHPDYYHTHEFLDWEEYTNAIRQIARSEDIPLIEISHTFPSDQAWMPDGVHLSAQGQQMIADRVWASLQRPSLADLLHIPLPVANAEMAPSLD